MIRPRVLLMASIAISSISCSKSADNGGTPASVTPPTPAISLSASASSLDITQGAAANVTVTVARTGGFAGDVTITVEGLPTGVTASALTITAALTSGTVMLTAGAATLVAPASVTFRGRGTGVTSATASLTLNVRAAAAHVSVAGADLLLNGKKWVPHGVQFLGLLSATSNPTVCAGNTGPAYAHLGQAGLDAAHSWDADVVRFQVSQYALNPANTGVGPAGYSPDYVARVQQTVALARQSGFVVIVSMQHEFCSGDPFDHAMPTADTKKAWDTIAPFWANDDGVILELFNEPELLANKTYWPVWQSGGASTKKDKDLNATPETAIGHQDLINEIRSLGNRNVLIVDGMHFAKELDGMPQLNDPMSSLVYAVHPFFGQAATADADSGTWPTFFGNLATQIPVFVTAWNTNNSSCELYYPDLSRTLLKYLSDHQIGIVAVDFDVLTTIVSDFSGTPNYFDGGWGCTDPAKATTTGEGPGQLLCQEYRTVKGDPIDRCGPAHP